MRCFLLQQTNQSFCFLPPAERVKEENLAIVCIPTSFQVSASLLCFLLVQVLTNIFPLAVVKQAHNAKHVGDAESPSLILYQALKAVKITVQALVLSGGACQHVSAGFYKRLRERNQLNFSFAVQLLQGSAHTNLAVKKLAGRGRIVALW